MRQVVMLRMYKAISSADRETKELSANMLKPRNATRDLSLSDDLLKILIRSLRHSEWSDRSTRNPVTRLICRIE